MASIQLPTTTLIPTTTLPTISLPITTMPATSLSAPLGTGSLPTFGVGGVGQPNTLTGGLGQVPATSLSTPLGTGSLPTFGVGGQTNTLIGGIGQVPTTSLSTLQGTGSLPTFGVGGQPNTLIGGLGQVPATSLNTSLGIGSIPTFGIGGQPNTSTTGIPGQILTTQFQQPGISYGGLGGTPNSANQDNTLTLSNTTTNGIKPEHRSAKDQAIVPELLILVEDFKNHVKNERVKLTEITAITEKAVERVSEFCDEIHQSVSNVSNVNHRQMLNLDAIRQMINQDIRDAETAQLIRDTPMNLQQNYQFPMQYLFRMLKDFEDRMIVYQREIAKSEAAVSAGCVSPLNSAELCTALKGSKDVLIVLAAKVKTLHEKVLNEVETHQNFLQFVHGDLAADVFSAKQRAPAQSYIPPRHGLPFPDRQQTVDPSKMYMSYLAASKITPSGVVMHTCHPSMNVQPNKPFDTLPFNVTGTGSPSFYHSQQANPIHITQNIPTQSVSPGLSLKRSKH